MRVNLPSLKTAEPLLLLLANILRLEHLQDFLILVKSWPQKMC